ncbi:Pentatricopeptide repeat [Macleaya cordata]|uniref:Pentatricopeptide repeat n=1 Tax=Macleaya cordata TaxID=56857 RepID=A0A200QGM3_MACCD|nr:Pentatricopeptide repeat [Macleaya cordata]
MNRSPYEAAILISKALISASNRSIPTRSWNHSLEQTLHQLGCRNSLNPSLVARVIDPFLLDHHSLAIGFFNWASQQPGFSHNSLTYQSLLKSLSISRQFNSVEKFLKQIKTQKISLDPSIYRSVIASQIIGKKTQNAFFILNEIKELSREIGPDICNSLLAALASDGYIDFAKKLFDEMSVRSIPFSTVGFGVFIGKFCRVAELDKTLGLLDEVKRGVSVINGSVIAVLIVDGLCQVSRLSEAFWVLDELRNRDCKPDFMAYRIVAEALKVAGQSEEAEKVLKKKRKLGVAPRTNDYREFLFGLISERRIQESKELGEVIIGGNFPIEDDVLNALIGSISAIHPDSAILFCKFMMEKGRFPTLLTLSNLSRSLCKNGKTEEMVGIFQGLSSKDYFLDLESFNVMVSFLCKAGRVKEAYSVLQDMKKKGFTPDVSSYNSLMEACCREDLLRPAKRLWDEMFANGCRGNLKTYNTLIQKFSEAGEVDEAFRLFHHMMEKEVSPDATTYISLLKGLCKEAKVEAAYEIFNKSIKQDIMLAQTILTTLVSSLCKEGNFLAASKVIRGLPPETGNPDSHILLLKCLADAGELGMATEHILWVGDCSPSTSQAIITELVSSLSSSLKPEPVIQLLRAMQQKGLISNNDTWMDLCNGSFTGC